MTHLRKQLIVTTSGAYELAEPFAVAVQEALETKFPGSFKVKALELPNRFFIFAMEGETNHFVEIWQLKPNRFDFKTPREYYQLYVQHVVARFFQQANAEVFNRLTREREFLPEAKNYLDFLKKTFPEKNTRRFYLKQIKTLPEAIKRHEGGLINLL